MSHDQSQDTHGVEEILPLSPLQEGLLFHAVYDEDGLDVYTVQIVLRLRGAFREDRMKAAAVALLRRHANLRAGFVYRGLENPVQVIPRDVEVRWESLDVSGLEAGARARRFREIVAEDRERRFNLESPPLMRFTLVRIEAGEHRLILTNHHILLDGWSMPVMLQELFALYEADGDDARLAPVTPYREYLRWLSGQDKAVAARAWRIALAEVEEGTRIASGQEEARAEFPEMLQLELSEEATARLERRVRQLGLTLNTAVQGAWGILLGRITGREDVVFGVTVSGRPADVPGIEGMVGLFINTVPARLRFKSSERFSEVLGRLQEEQSKLMAHQHLKLTEIQRLAGVGELFDTLVVFENYPAETQPGTATKEGLRIDYSEGADASHYPLGLTVIPGVRMRLSLNYRKEVVDPELAGTLLRGLERIFEAVAADAESRVWELDILSSGERRQVLEEWNGTSEEVPGETVAELFEEQAGRAPGAEAVTYEGESLSYGELNGRANRLAHWLIGEGVGPEDVVGICLERTPELVVAILAVLKSGAAYLPLDPEYPRERLALMTEDAAPKLVLVAGGTAAVGARKVALDQAETQSALLGMPDGNPDNTERRGWLGPANAAYVIYTSGSTGRPKAVVNSHAGLMNRLFCFQQICPLDSTDRIIQRTSVSFDVSVWEVLGPLLIGARIILPRIDGQRDIAYLTDLARREEVTTLHFTPSLFAAWLGSEGNHQSASIRRVFCGGEALIAEHQHRFFESSQADLYNLYGPAETAIDVTYWRCQPDWDGESVPIGRPVWNTQVYVLDRGLRPVPVGVSGELYVAGVAAGKRVFGAGGADGGAVRGESVR